MSKRIVRVAAAQIAPVLDRAGGTLERMLAAVAEAASKGVALAVFPETFLPYYPYFSYVEPPFAIGAAHLRLYEEAVVVPGPVSLALAEAAKRHAMVLVVGVNERDGGSLYNTQLVFDADGTLALKRRKITPTYHERMIWGQGDGAGLAVVDTAVGRVGALACWEHFNPLARYCLMAQGEEIHAAQFPGSLVGPIFAEQMEVAIRHHALEAGCFVVNATGWLTDGQIAAITPDPAKQKGLRGGNCTAIISPEGRHVVPPMTQGEGLLIADCDMALVTKRKRMMDSAGHYARPDMLQLHVDARPTTMLVRHSEGLAAPAPRPLPLSPVEAPPPSGQPIPARAATDRPDADRPDADRPDTDRHDPERHDTAAVDGTADQRVAVLRSAAG